MQRGEGTTRGRRNYKNVGNRGAKFSSAPRSLSNIRGSKRAEDVENQELLQKVIDKADTPSASRMQKKNPTRENPKPDDPSVKLEQYVGEWIDTDRNNIQVELRDRFEDRMIEEHIKYIVVDSDALQYEDRRDVETMVLAWTAYAYCNIAYRLIITLPSSNRVEASDFLRELHDSDQPRNTPAMAEMLAHIGKSDVPYYGRLRIDGPLLQAKRRVARAVYLLKDEKPWADEFVYERDGTGDQLDEWENGIWDDRDSWDWLRKRAVDFINLELVKHRTFDDIRNGDDKTGLKFTFSLPHVDVKDRNEKGLRNVYKPVEVIAYWTMIRFLKKEQIDIIMAAFILVSIPFEFFKTMDKPLEDWNNDWKKQGFEYSDATMHDLLEYLGIPRLEEVMSFRTLRYNYFVIVNNYNSSVRARLERIFDMSTISKEEFGDEAQAIQCVEPDDRSNPYLQSSFMFDNKQKIAAGGIFNYAFRVRHKLAQEMMMKRTRPSMIAEIVSKFGKGRK